MILVPLFLHLGVQAVQHEQVSHEWGGLAGKSASVWKKTAVSRNPERPDRHCPFLVVELYDVGKGVVALLAYETGKADVEGIGSGNPFFCSSSETSAGAVSYQCGLSFFTFAVQASHKPARRRKNASKVSGH